MYFSFTKFSNKFHNFQAMSQHLSNKQDVNILKHTYAYLISMRFIMNRPKLNPKNNNLYSRSCSKDFDTTYIPLNVFLSTVRTTIFTRFIIRGQNNDDLPSLILRDVLKY